MVIEGKIKQKLSVIIPAYNEEKLIEHCIIELKKIFKSSKIKNYEIIVVDDGSHDQTYDVLHTKFSNDNNINIVSYPLNQGKGYAIQQGFAISSGNIVAFIDADLDLHPSHILSLYSFMLENNYDMVIGSKRHPQSILVYPPLRKLYSNIYYYFIRMLFGLPVKDTQTGVKVFKREVLEFVLPKIVVKRYAFDLELLVLAHMGKYKIGEAPIVLEFRNKFSYTIGIKSIYKIIIDTLGVFFRLYIKRSYSRH
jgi:glycosyltransferase involved in cell wall biosynthesis